MRKHIPPPIVFGQEALVLGAAVDEVAKENEHVVDGNHDEDYFEVQELEGEDDEDGEESAADEEAELR